MADEVECSHVHEINGTQAQCDFVKTNDLCQDSEGYFNYVEILYCTFGGGFEPYLGIALYCQWIFVLFVALAVSTDDFFCPNLATISKTLR